MNNTFRKLTFASLAIFSLTNVQAQNYEDVLRYSSLSSGTTARSMAIGGAAGSLGADFSSASVNPAGMAVYRKSELSITPYFSINNTKGSYIGNETSDNNTAFKLGNLGLAINTSNSKKSGWKGFTFSFGANKLADYNNHATYQGVNGQSSFSEVMAIEAQNYGYTEEQSAFGFLGYQGYLLNNATDLQSIPYHNVIATGGTLKQTKYSESKGGMNDYVISVAGNYSDKLMIGVSLGITSYRFKRVTDFVESDNTGLMNDFYSFTLRESIETSGNGVNGKFGIMYNVNPLFRIGASIHTPTIASLTDYVDYNLRSDMEGLGAYDITPQSLYRSDYSITTPMRAIVSATGFFGTKGFVTGDLEYVPYNSMRIRYDDNSIDISDYERDQQNFISNNFRGAINAKVGAEVRANRDISVRAGAAYYGNPYKSGINDMGGDRLDISFGMGFRLGENSLLDLTYVNSNRKYKESPYYIPLAGVTNYDATLVNNRNVIAMTLAIKF